MRAGDDDDDEWRRRGWSHEALRRQLPQEKEQDKELM